MNKRWMTVPVYIIVTYFLMAYHKDEEHNEKETYTQIETQHFRTMEITGASASYNTIRMVKYELVGPRTNF